MRPSFSSFREYMDTVDSLFLEHGDLCMFFKKDGSVYGATESGRITYARMKNPESKEDIAWKKDASIILYDLQKDSGDNRIIIGSSQIDKFDPIDQGEAEKILKKKGRQIPSISEDDDEEAYYGEE